MSTPFISTATVGSAHSSDILGVSITKKFTITCSSDGFLKLWNNNSSERKLHCELLVDKLGLHHVEVLEDVFDAHKVLLISTVSFRGIIYIFKYDYDSDKLIDLKFDPLNSGVSKKKSFWAPIFDTMAGCTIFACTTVTGKTIVFDVTIDEGNFKFSYKGELFANDTSFATCICSKIADNRIVVGHQNGNAYLYDFQQMLLSFNFESYGLKSSSDNNSLHIVRSVKFSPNNSELLAIANDSGSFGTISLYDVKFGEYLGSFTLSTHSSNVGVGNFAHSKWCLAIDFNEQGDKLVSCSLDNTVRVWDVESRTFLTSLKLNETDLDDKDVAQLNDMDSSACTSIKYIPPGIFGEDGLNEGIVVVGFDRSIRWFREAGGI